MATLLRVRSGTRVCRCECQLWALGNPQSRHRAGSQQPGRGRRETKLGTAASSRSLKSARGEEAYVATSLQHGDTAPSVVPSSPIVETDIPARLDRLPWGRFHTLVVVALGITWILDGLEVTLGGRRLGSPEAKPRAAVQQHRRRPRRQRLHRRRRAWRAVLRLAHRSAGAARSSSSSRSPST